MKGLLLAFVFALLIFSSVGFVSAIVPVTANPSQDIGSSCNSNGWTEVVNLTTVAKKLNIFDPVNTAKQTVTSADMPYTLASGTIRDSAGNSYTYTQSIGVGLTPSQFSTSGGDVPDPMLLYQVGTNAQTASLYKTIVSFSPSVDLSDPPGARNQMIKILGKDYTIGSAGTSSIAPIFLYGGTNIFLLGGSPPKIVVVNGVSHSVELVSTTDSNDAKIMVDGVYKDVDTDSAFTFAGNVLVYVKEIHHPLFQGDIRSIDLMIGDSLSSPIVVYNNAQIKMSASLTAVPGTWGAITRDANGKVIDFAVYIAKQTSQADHVRLLRDIGDVFFNPVFGSLGFLFNNANPSLGDGDNRDTITVETDNNQYGYVTFNSARSGTTGAKKLTYAYDKNTASNAVQPILAHQVVSSNDRGYIRVKEGENAKTNDWIVVNQGDAGTILEVTDLTIDSATSGEATFQDVITGESQTITLTNNTGTNGYYQKSGVSFFGGTGYTIRLNQAGTIVNIIWNNGSTALFPRIKLKNGGWMAFLTASTVSSTTSVIFPDGQINLATNGDGGRVGNANSEIVNGVNWMIDSSAGASNQVIYGISNANGNCDFSVAKGPAILFFEPKKSGDSNYGDFICVPMTTIGNKEIAIADAAMSGVNSGYVLLTSDTYVKQAVDKYGTFIQKEDRTNLNGIAIIRSPKYQMYLNALLVGIGNVTNCTNSTLNGTKVNTITHRLCSVNNTCVQVSGKGTSSCSADNDCNNQTGPRHLDCKYHGTVGWCAYVSGYGNNTCLNSNNCNQYHSVCLGLTCSAILGSGNNTCVSDNDCSHLGCDSFNRCTRIAGAGTNTCTTVGNTCIENSPPLECTGFFGWIKRLFGKC